MAEHSKIEWCDATFNPWRGCTKVSDGCKYCYAETLSSRNPAVLGEWGPNGKRVIAAESYWQQPHRWSRTLPRKVGRRPRVFCASLADVFEDRPELVEPRRRLFTLICTTPELDWLLLTKRPENALPMMVEAGLYATANPDLPCPQPNLWIGASVEDQPSYDKRIGALLRIPAAVHFLSIEPLLGPVDMRLGGASMPDHAPHNPLPKIDWVIVGGESGREARPMNPYWAESLRDQCVEARIPFFFKQWGEYCPGLGDRSMFVHLVNGHSQAGGAETHEWGGGLISHRVGKKRAGRLLGGREWNEYPKRPTPEPRPIAYCQLNGHATEYVDGQWRYTDTKENCNDVPERACIYCGLRPSNFNEHDPCIANLPGVKAACCGHGTHEGYVLFENGQVIRGKWDHLVYAKEVSHV